MPANSFKFISPGVFVNEIDNSETPAAAIDQVGPVIIGRARRGPANVPVQVKDFNEFVELFGYPVVGTGEQEDTWREGDFSSPTYAPYAAEAWLKNNTPLTFIRLLGTQHTSAADYGGEAGWKVNPDRDYGSTEGDNAGAFGLFVIDSGSAGSHLTGTLAAVFYVVTGSVSLVGEDPEGTYHAAATEGLIRSIGEKQFKVIIKDNDSSKVLETAFNFNESSDKYIRKVFNTSPVRTNSTINSAENTLNYWLGESFERSLDAHVTGSDQYAFIAPLAGDLGNGDDYKFAHKSANSGWVFSQDFRSDTGSFDPRNCEKLFKIHSLYGGEWEGKNIKISISDIKLPQNDTEKYGTFSVLVRRASDSDEFPTILEQFSNCNLNPSSPNFIASKIGDKRMIWDDIKKVYVETGLYDNKSKYIRVELNDTIIDNMHNPASLPFGVFGPVAHRGFTFTSGSATAYSLGSISEAYTGVFAKGNGSCPNSLAGTDFIDTADLDFTGSFVFPSLPLVEKATDTQLANPKKSYFGVDTCVDPTSTRFDSGYGDYLRTLSNGYESLGEGDYTTYSWIFTLDDVSGSSVYTGDLEAAAEYVSGSRAAGTSISAVSNWQTVIENEHNRFTFPLYGAHDGLNIKEMEPLANKNISSSPSELTDPVYNTYKRAIDIISDAETLSVNIATIPGLTQRGLTNMLAFACEQRGDVFAIIDPESGYTARAETDASAYDRIGNTQEVVNSAKDRGLNSSYAAMYDPWVQAVDARSGSRVILPPSIAALGAMAKTDATSGPWFAPAGFTRGGLSKGDAGLSIVGTTRKLLQEDRDKLYEARVNPIASMPDVGITIWGQKTMLPSETSALNRVNVRRMMIYIKKAISRLAAQTLFEPNVEDTWRNFKVPAERVLQDVKNRYGINNFKLILDKTTTTPDLVDRNIIYAKIVVQPTRAVEFFAIDFVLTNSGASFED